MFCEPMTIDETKPIKVSCSTYDLLRHALFDVGETVDGMYEIRQVIGEGGMGCVYEAYQPLLERHVAIKILWPGKPPRRLRAEGVMLASLNHPSLVSVHGMGSYRNIHYLVLERLHGMTLKEYMGRAADRGGCSITNALDILASLAEALDFMHRSGMVHRDVKPTNIMIEGSGRVVLMDPGSLDVEDGEETIMGTPGYMAPECFTRSACCHAVDIYALGVIAFELLTGRQPFSARQVFDLVQMHLEDTPPRLSSERADVPEQLDALVADMLSKKPQYRPKSGREIARCLRALLRELTVH